MCFLYERRRRPLKLGVHHDILGRPASDQKTAVLRLKRVLISVLAEQGVELPVVSDDPAVRMVDQEIVREQFYSHTPAEGSPEQKGNFRRQNSRSMAP